MSFASLQKAIVDYDDHIQAKIEAAKAHNELQNKQNAEKKKERELKKEAEAQMKELERKVMPDTP